MAAYTKEQLEEIVKGLSPEQKKLIKERRLAARAYNDLGAFGEYVFGHKPAKHHKMIIKMLTDNPHDNLLIVAPPRHAKCMAEGSMVQLKDGSRKRIELLQVGDEVCSFNEYSQQPEFDKIINWWNRGKQKCFGIKTATGREVMATENHRFYTPYGWKSMKDLMVGDSVASPRLVNAEHMNPLNVDELSLLAYWIAKGSPGQSYHITNTMPEIINDLQQIAARNGLTCIVRKAEGRAESISLTCNNDRSKSPINLLRKYGFVWSKTINGKWSGVRGLTSMYKFIPEDVFRCSNDRIAIFLNRLFACDGWTRPYQGIHYTSKSEMLCRDVQSLLMRFNIRSIVKSTKRMYKNRELIFWKVQISANEDIKRFASQINMMGKENKIAWAIERIDNISTFDRSNKESLRWNEWFPLLKNKNNSFSSKYKGRTSVHVVHKSAVRDKNDVLLRLTNQTILWEPIISIEDAGEQYTYDIETEKNHNFIANNMYVHNTEWCGVIYPTWRVARDPGVHIIYISSSEAQAIKQSVDVRNTIQYNERFQKVAPDVYPDTGRFWAKQMWQVKSPRFLSDKDPTMIVAGSDSQKVLGSTADEIIIDDLNDERNTATPAMRQKVQDWVARTVLTRLSPKGRVVCIMTRWHAADLAAYFKEIGFKCLELQALGCGGEDICDMDHFHRSPKNEPLWPELWPFERLLKQKQIMQDEWKWESVYQGNPTPAGGAIWKEEWWKYYRTEFSNNSQEDLPIAPDEFSLKIQSWDTSQHTGQENDWSVGETWGYARGNFFLLDVFRDKLEYPQLKKMVVEQYGKHKPNVVLVEDASSGASLIQELPIETSLPIIGIKPESDKQARSRAASYAAQAGRIYLPATSSWLYNFVREHSEFPNGRWNDQVDSTAQAITWIRQNTGDDASFASAADELSSRRTRWAPSASDVLSADNMIQEGLSRWSRFD